MVIQVSGLTISDKVLSGGERIYIQRLARKTGEGKTLKPKEESFVRSMLKRNSNYSL